MEFESARTNVQDDSNRTNLEPNLRWDLVGVRKHERETPVQWSDLDLQLRRHPASVDLASDSSCSDDFRCFIQGQFLREQRRNLLS